MAEENKEEAVTGFWFSFAAAEAAKKNIELQIDAQEARLDKIARKVRFADQPIVTMILHLSHDAEELKTLSRALDRVADIMPVLDDLKAKKAMIEQAIEKPDQLKWMFGDLSFEVEKLLASAGIDSPTPEGDTEP